MAFNPTKKEMDMLQNEAQNLGKAISNAKANGTPLEKSKDFWQYFVGLNDMLADMCFDEDETPKKKPAKKKKTKSK